MSVSGSCFHLSLVTAAKDNQRVELGGNDCCILGNSSSREKPR